MIRALILVHRWLSIALGPLFVLWFATGIVMHFVPFPAQTDAARVAGLATFDAHAVVHGPAEAIGASRLDQVRRVKLWQRSDGPIYLILARSGTVALRADDLGSAAVTSAALALGIASDAARRRGLDPANADVVATADYDQWTVPNRFDVHRPLYRVALHDETGTELYVSSRTGEVVLDTNRSARAWNYAGSVVHWIYPTMLRRHWAVWNVTVWWLSLLAVIAALSGTMVGLLRLRRRGNQFVSPYRRWHAWHHWLGLACSGFVLTWIVSGWLSMDHGRLFPDGAVSASEADGITGTVVWTDLTADVLQSIPTQAREIEWFAFGGRLYQRVRTDATTQRLTAIGGSPILPAGAFLAAQDVHSAVSRAVDGCTGTSVVTLQNDYPLQSDIANAPVYRATCGDTWYHVDGADGTSLDKLDPRRRAYRWLYLALHTLDFPVLMARPAIRTSLIVMLCALGCSFSITGLVIGWRRLRLRS